MFDITHILEQLEIRRKVLNWLIDGQFIHCIPVSLWLNVTPEWIVENYNMELSHFKK